MSDLLASFWEDIARRVCGLSTRNGGKASVTVSKTFAGTPRKEPEFVLTREPSTDQGTPGRLVHESGWSCVTLELPWRDNKPFVSCIPPGTYKFIRQPSMKYGQAYTAQNVDGRWAVLIHVGNLAGDKMLGYESDSEGCTLLGRGFATFQAGPPPAGQKAQKGITASRDTMKDFNRVVGSKEFSMRIV